MEALTIINGVADPELSAEIGRYAQLSGFGIRSIGYRIDPERFYQWITN